VPGVKEKFLLTRWQARTIVTGMTDTKKVLVVGKITKRNGRVVAQPSPAGIVWGYPAKRFR